MSFQHSGNGQRPRESIQSDSKCVSLIETRREARSPCPQSLLLRLGLETRHWASSKILDGSWRRYHHAPVVWRGTADAASFHETRSRAVAGSQRIRGTWGAGSWSGWQSSVAVVASVWVVDSWGGFQGFRCRFTPGYHQSPFRGLRM